jgi:hypothetical protein
VEGETTLETLDRAVEAGALGADEGERFMVSAAVQRALLQVGRATDADTSDPEHVPEALKQLMAAFADAELKEHGVGDERAGVASFAALIERLGKLQEHTRAALERLLGAPIG